MDRINIVELLLEKGADVNAKDKYQIAPLHIAVYYEKGKISQLLLQKGADRINNIEWDAYDFDKGTFTDFWRDNVRRGANEDVQGKKSITLWESVKSDDIETARNLIEKGADINAKDNSHSRYTPLHWASYYGRLEIAKLLIDKGADVNATYGTEHRNALQLAIDHKHEDIAALLISKGANVNAKTKSSNYSAHTLHMAAKHGNLKITRLLLEKGAEVNAKNQSGATPLHKAALEGHADVVKNLLDNGADVNARDNSQNTPLHVSVEYRGNDETIKLLLEKGADVNARDGDHSTSLHKAVERGKTEIVRLLIAKVTGVNASQNAY